MNLARGEGRAGRQGRGRKGVSGPRLYILLFSGRRGLLSQAAARVAGALKPHWEAKAVLRARTK